MNPISTRDGSGTSGRLRTAVLAVLLACVGGLALAGSAAAAPFSMTLNNGQLNLGFAFKGAKILPAPNSVQTAAPPAPPTQLPDLWAARDTTDVSNPVAAAPFGCLTPVLFDVTTNPPTPTGTPNPSYPCPPNPPAATVSGDLTGNAITIQGSPNNGPANKHGLPNGFRFPIMIVPNPLDNSPVPVTLAATGDVTGTFDSGTGALSLNGPIEARVLTGLATNPLGSYCALPLAGLTLSTTSNADFPGVPFTSGITGNGAITGTYNITNDATSVGGANCATVNQVSKGAGSIWLSNGIAEPPTCPANTTGIPPNCVPDPCPAGTVGTAQPDCAPAKANISRVQVQIPKQVRRLRNVKVTIRITNNGNITATGVRVQLRGKRLKANFPVGTIAANTTRTVRVRTKFRTVGRITAKVQVVSNNAGTRTVKKVVRVKR